MKRLRDVSLEGRSKKKIRASSFGSWPWWRAPPLSNNAERRHREVWMNRQHSVTVIAFRTA